MGETATRTVAEAGDADAPGAVRRALARDLHGALTPTLYGMTLLAEATARRARGGDAAAVAEQVDHLGAMARQALRELRRIVYGMEAGPQGDESLADALERRLDAVERRAGVAARLQAGPVGDLPDVLRDGLFRIAEEALDNALRHAGARAVTVRFGARGGRLELAVEDDGCGCDPARATGRGGGLARLRARAAALGGELAIESAPGAGTRVVARVPLAAAPAGVP